MAERKVARRIRRHRIPRANGTYEEYLVNIPRDWVEELFPSKLVILEREDNRIIIKPA